MEALANDSLDGLFEATALATEEAIVNAMVAARTLDGIEATCCTRSTTSSCARSCASTVAWTRRDDPTRDPRAGRDAGHRAVRVHARAARRGRRIRTPCRPARDGARTGPGHTRLPRRFEPALLRAPSKALVVRRTRLDAGQPELQNWEVALDVVRADPATADGDELLALWMNARTGADGVSDTGLSLARSIDGGRSFAPVATTAPPMAAGIPFDPMVESDPVAGAVYVGAMSQSSADRAAWIAPSIGADSAAFQVGRVVATGVRVDKGWLAAGPAPGGGRALYFIDRSGARASTDRAITWSAAVDLPQSQGLPLPRVYADGTLGVTYIRSDQPVYTRSNDLARSFAAPSLIHDPAAPATGLMDATPGSYRVAPATVIARSPVDGTIYAVLADVTRRVGTEADVDLLLFESVDGGATWSAGRNVTAAAPAWSDQFLPWIEVDAQGRLHLAWYDTRRHAGNDAAASAPVDFWYAVSADRGRNWEAQRLTESPVESASTNWSPLGPQPFQFLGDYITLALSAHAAYVAHPVAEGGVIGMAVSRIALGGGSARPINDPRGLTGAWYEPATERPGHRAAVARRRAPAALLLRPSRRRQQPLPGRHPRWSLRLRAGDQRTAGGDARRPLQRPRPDGDPARALGQRAPRLRLLRRCDGGAQRARRHPGAGARTHRARARPALRLIPARRRGLRRVPGAGAAAQPHTSPMTRAKLPPRILPMRASLWPRADSSTAMASKRRGVLRSGMKV